MAKELDALVPSKKREAPATSHGKHPRKMMCTPANQMVKSEPVQPTTPPVEMETTTYESPPPVDTSIPLSFFMPNTESALHVLRCAFNEITGLMAKDKSNPNKYIFHARNIEKLMGKQLTLTLVCIIY